MKRIISCVSFFMLLLSSPVFAEDPPPPCRSDLSYVDSILVVGEGTYIELVDGGKSCLCNDKIKKNRFAFSSADSNAKAYTALVLTAIAAKKKILIEGKAICDFTKDNDTRVTHSITLSKD